MTKQSPLYLAFILCGLTACQAPENKTATNNLTTPPLENYALGQEATKDLNNQIFQNATFFLWREDMTPEMVSTVLLTAKRYDAAGAEQRRVRAELKTLTKDINELHSEILSSLDGSATEVIDNVDLLKDLKLQRVSLTTEEKSQLSDLETQINDLSKDLPPMPEQTASLQNSFDTMLDEYSILFQKQEALGIEGDELFQIIQDTTDFPASKPDRVTFNFYENGTVGVDIVNWPHKGVRWSTEDGSIQNVRYKTNGGIIEFELETIPGQEYYVFHLNRTPSNQLAYQGEIRRYKGNMQTHSGTLERRGVAKLSMEK